MLKNKIILYFCALATSGAQKKVRFHFHSRGQSVTSEKETWLFVSQVATERKKLYKCIFSFFNMLKALKKEVKGPCVCVIAFAQSAHFTHSAQSFNGAAMAPHMDEKVTWAQLYINEISIIATSKWSDMLRGSAFSNRGSLFASIMATFTDGRPPAWPDDLAALHGLCVPCVSVEI